MRKFFVWACLNAALIGWSGLSRADDSYFANYTPTDVKTESALHDASQSDGGPSQSCDFGCGECVGDWLDNTQIFTGADIYKSIGDRLTNINGGTGSLTSSFGSVTGFNTGFRLGNSKLRGQVGASYGIYDFKGRLAIVPGATSAEQQGFFTTGVYKRADILNDGDRLSYGVVVDAFSATNWGINANNIDLGQLRGKVGYALNERFEVGVFGTAPLWKDQAAVTVAGAPGVRRQIRAANQFNSYIRLNTAFGGSLTGYIGGFGQADIQSWQFGAIGEAPLSSYFSLYSNFNYAVPGAAAGANGSGEEQFNIMFGLTYYIGGKAVSPSVTGQQGLPLLNVANNGSFLVTD